MVFIRGKGAPGKHTKGYVGDKYIDMETGNQYICVLAFGIFGGDDTEYEWKFDCTVKIESEKIPGVDFQENKTKIEIDELESNITEDPFGSAVNQPVKELKGADIDGEPEDIRKPRYNNYSKQYKHNKN